MKTVETRNCSAETSYKTLISTASFTADLAAQKSAALITAEAGCVPSSTSSFDQPELSLCPTAHPVLQDN